MASDPGLTDSTALHRGTRIALRLEGCHCFRINLYISQYMYVYIYIRKKIYTVYIVYNLCEYYVSKIYMFIGIIFSLFLWKKKSKDGGAEARDFCPLRCWPTDTTTHQKGLGRIQAEYPWTQIPNDSSHFSVLFPQPKLSKRLPQTTHMSIIF